MFRKSTIKSLDVFYAMVEHLIVELRSDGRRHEADMLDHLMHKVAWTTGSELLPELAIVLGKMEGEHPKEMRSLIDQCAYFARHHRRILHLK
jgi:hypothetical protein